VSEPLLNLLIVGEFKVPLLKTKDGGQCFGNSLHFVEVDFPVLKEKEFQFAHVWKGRKLVS